MKPAAPLLLCCAAAHAHVVPFEFQAPRGAGNHADGGAVLAWFDGNAAGGTADIFFSAVRPAWVPWSRVAPGAELRINSTELPVESPIDVLHWDTTGVPPGCWQPIARVQDPVEGVVTHVAPGVVTVGGAGGWPPSAWVTVAPRSPGVYDVAIAVDSPEAPAELVVTLEQPDGAVWPVAADAGRIDLRSRTGGPWYFHAVAVSV